ncbi:unnamed protein product, partial [Mesorhabditis belari]|uniref:Uncharacterized protein n=1 Tax=Mesorhabditis belari TaxID=2138241 RepID=A0AAF3JBZ9_9BILA
MNFSTWFQQQYFIVQLCYCLSIPCLLLNIFGIYVILYKAPIEMRKMSQVITYWVIVGSSLDLYLKIIGTACYDVINRHIVIRYYGIMSFFKVNDRVQMTIFFFLIGQIGFSSNCLHLSALAKILPETYKFHSFYKIGCLLSLINLIVFLAGGGDYYVFDQAHVSDNPTEHMLIFVNDGETYFNFIILLFAIIAYSITIAALFIEKNYFKSVEEQMSSTTKHKLHSYLKNSVIQTCVPLITLLPAIFNIIVLYLRNDKGDDQDLLVLISMLIMSLYGNITVITTFLLYQPYRAYFYSFCLTIYPKKKRQTITSA